MDILIPELIIDEQAGFLPSVDIFARRDFGVRLTNIIEKSGQSLVIGLDAKWGEGKSTFVKMWKGYLESSEREIECIYFDAFKSDYQKDPFFVIASELYQLIDDESIEFQNEFKDKAAAALKVISRIGLRVGVKAITAGVLDETVFDSDIDNISDEITSATNNFVAERLEEAKADKQKIEEFREFLTRLPKSIGTDKPIIIIIDELDRCRPDFALDVFETIKHFFSLSGITFVLVLNKDQLEQSIEYKYGARINAPEYLQKFVNLWATLPSKGTNSVSHSRKYLEHCLVIMGYKGHKNSAAIFLDLVDHYKLSLREVEQSLTNFALIENAGIREASFGTACLAPYLSVIKVKFPDVYKKIGRNELTFGQLVMGTNLETLEAKGQWLKASEPHPVRFFLKVCLAEPGDDFNDDYELFQGNNFAYSDQAIEEIVPVLDSFIGAN